MDAGSIWLVARLMYCYSSNLQLSCDISINYRSHDLRIFKEPPVVFNGGGPSYFKFGWLLALH